MDSFHVHDNQSQMENIIIFVKWRHKIYKSEALQQKSKIHNQNYIQF